MTGLVLPGVPGLVTAGGVRVPKKFEFSNEQSWIDRTLTEVGDLSDIEIFFGQCVVAKYVRDTIGTMKLLASEQTKLEDKYQGKVGLLLKKGPLAFQNRSGADFGGANPQVGEWVIYSASDGRDADLICVDGLTHCPARILEDAEIKGVIKYPARIW